MSENAETYVKGTSNGQDRLMRSALVAAVVIAVAAGLVVGALRLTASPAVCGSCHEIAPKVATWTASAHAQVGCPACHEEVRPWYAFPQTLAERVSMLQRDLSTHRAGSRQDAVMALAAVTPNVPDENCLQCHDLSRSITLKFGTLINHAEHAKRNRSCISCHISTGHPETGVERPILLMAQCFTCHGRTKGAKAPGTCGTCHPKSFSLRPESHRTSRWQTIHGKAALSNQQPCSMCHETTFCRACHGLDMPHPKTWVRGTPGHATVGAANRALCAKCHADKPDLCSMCHHAGLATAKRPWVAEHPSLVAKKGTAFCMDCHDPVFCYNCHTRQRRSDTPTGTN